MSVEHVVCQTEYFNGVTSHCSAFTLNHWHCHFNAYVYTKQLTLSFQCMLIFKLCLSSLPPFSHTWTSLSLSSLSHTHTIIPTLPIKKKSIWTGKTHTHMHPCTYTPPPHTHTHTYSLSLSKHGVWSGSDHKLTNCFLFPEMCRNSAHVLKKQIKFPFPCVIPSYKNAVCRWLIKIPSTSF